MQFTLGMLTLVRSWGQDGALRLLCVEVNECGYCWCCFVIVFVINAVGEKNCRSCKKSGVIITDIEVCVIKLNSNSDRY